MLKEENPSQKENEAKNEKSELEIRKSDAGMFLASNHAKMIWQGNKTLIVKGINFKDSVGKIFYLVGGNDCYGSIKINNVYPIDLEQFKKLSDKHRINETERSHWWQHKRELYAYEFEFTKFDEPRRVAAPAKLQTFIEEVKFLSEEEAKKLVEPFKSIKLQKASKEFSNEKDLADYLFGG